MTETSESLVELLCNLATLNHHHLLMEHADFFASADDWERYAKVLIHISHEFLFAEALA